MRSINLGFLLAPLLFSTGCSIIGEFDGFKFGGSSSDGSVSDKEPDGGPDAAGGDGGPTDAGGGADGGPNDASDAGDAGPDVADAMVDAGPEPDPICEAAGCDPAAECDSSSGVAVCACPAGYFDQHGDGTACLDLDECRAETYECPEDSTCANNVGGYDCNCNLGFVDNNGTCIDECIVLLSTTCDTEALCVKPEGFGVCRCKFGYMDVSPAQDGSQCEVDDTCSALTCHELALCDTSGPTPACVCPPGYDGDGTLCMDVNECSDQSDDCSDNARCDNTPGRFLCMCNNGFTGDGKTCVDKDECVLNEHNCSPNALCANTTGAFTCTCGSGYSGDGVSCVDDNECTLGTANCSSNANCANTPGAFTCACKPGYSGDGQVCNDVNECATNNGGCGAGVPCANTPGSFTCGCAQGFKKNEADVCVDVNECEENLDNCSPNATCTNVTTGAPFFTCACPSGYTGDGVTCTDVNECSNNTHDCSPNANCMNTGGSFTCACKGGFTGDGNTCTDVNECTTNMHNCHPTRAVCTNTPGSFSCACSPGYTGNGNTCTDIDECATGTHTCSTGASCTNTTGSFSCACSGSASVGNGHICVSTAEATFPEPGAATSAKDVSLVVLPHAQGKPTLQCRSYKRATGPTESFAACANPITNPAASDDADNNGAWRTEIRRIYGASATPTFSYDYYVHDSLDGATRCPALPATDTAIFKLADQHLDAANVGKGYTDPGEFKIGASATTLANPFVAIAYNPLTSGFFTLRGTNLNTMSGAPYKAEMWSLRHRFVAHSGQRYILIRRVYGSRGAATHGLHSCAAARFEISDTSGNVKPGQQTHYVQFTCDAVVVNRAGAGVCIDFEDKTDAMSVSPSFGNDFGSAFGYGKSNKFMWRHLIDEKLRLTGESGYRNFSPKRSTTTGTGSAYELVLPDYSILRP